MATATIILPVFLWTMMAFQEDLLQAQGIQVLPPVNFTLTVTALAKILLQWKPNPDQDQMNYTVSYEVEILTPKKEVYGTKHTHSTRVAVLHNGFSARIRTLLLYNNSQIESNWVPAELQAPSGAVETSVTNLSCVIYTTINNAASLHCTWLAGKQAPQDTKYFLFYRYDSYTEECQEYSKDKWERNIGCQFSNTYIRANGIDQLAIHVNGSSKHSAIKPFEELFNQNTIGTLWQHGFWNTLKVLYSSHHVTKKMLKNWKVLQISWSYRRIFGTGEVKMYGTCPLNIYTILGGKIQLLEKVNPPRNVTVSLKEKDLQINWEEPVAFFPKSCLEYQLSIYNLKIRYEQIVKTTSNSFSLRIDDTCRYSIQIRANRQSWCDEGLWSDWTEPLYTGENHPGTPGGFKILIALVASACVITTLTVIICRKCHLWSRLFQPIPTPKNNLKNLFLNQNYQRARTFTSETETEIGSYLEDCGSYVEDLYSDVLEDSVI